MIDRLVEASPQEHPGPVRAARRMSGPQLGWAVAGLFFALYALLSVSRHQRMLSAAFDLGIFEQAVRAYAHGQAPIVPLKGPGYDLLGDHFHPVLALLAPAYRLFPTPVTLLLAQAALMALACLPVTRWAHRTAGPVGGLVLGLAFGSSWGIVSAVSFDFHEICFAVPLLAFAAEALAARRWRAAVLWALPLVLVKEDLGLTVAALGGYLLLRSRSGSGRWSRGPKGQPGGADGREGGSDGQAEGPDGQRRLRRLGLAVLVCGLGATVVEMAVLLPLANPHGVFDYWHQLPGAGSGAGAGGRGEDGGLPVGRALGLLVRFGWPPVKWLLLLMLAAPVAFVGLRSPLLLLCAPTLAWRLLADNEHYWQPGYHYSAILMPILFGALLDSLDRHPQLRSPRTLRRVLTACAAFAAVTTLVYPMRELALPSSWQQSAHVRTAHRLLAVVPDGATVAATNRLAPILVARAEVSLVCQEPGPRSATPPAWVVADDTDPTVKTPCAEAVTAAALAAYRGLGYLTVAQEDGITVLHRP
ncbi:hypothetical protein CFP65_0089 [Kitasatospora sp. MMS16-BH015]|uniref:DUF2079 domain-containing protein n=1 Tax=Kitasatospora sp. MMS16-BH015 TaxID=2018025 RepID=UPI000CA0CBA0|nr:DUF2079 domain-containing protein [Kitasatospora sp. MMS16-BH015]AUG75073.1 hypothetical protein CFP65_0089 [Kitasatospora sp. MMS16-BH015]